MRGSGKLHAMMRDDCKRCGARRKADGRPCENFAMENGRCRLHGGLTPKGKDWHKVQWPRRGAPMAKLEKKLREIERRQAKRRAQVAAMSPEERARYEAWQRTHKPGGVSNRHKARLDRDAQATLARLRSEKPAVRE